MDPAILEYLAKKEFLKVDIKTILEDEGFQKLNPVKKGRKKKTPEERMGVIDPKKCDARVWNEGYGAQCNFVKVDGECFCTRHLEKPGWLGNIHEKRPENPTLKGVEHHWKIDEDGNEVDTHKKKSQKKDENIVKKKRGRPKGSKNKNKKKDSNLPTLNSMSKAQIQELLDKKIKEKEEEMKGKDDVKDKDKVEMEEVEGEGEVEEDIIYKVDNVPYEIKDNEIMDPEDYSPIGQSDGKGGIIFEDEEAEEKHQENIKKYCK